GESKEEVAIPVGTGDDARHRAQGLVALPLVEEAVLEHGDDVLDVLVPARERSPRCRQARIPLAGGRGPRRRVQAAHADMDLIRELGGPALGALGEAALGARLNAPGHALEQIVLVAAAALLAEDLAVSHPELPDAQALETPNLHSHGLVHATLF